MGEFNSEDHYIYYCGQEAVKKKWHSRHGQEKEVIQKINETKSRVLWKDSKINKLSSRLFKKKRDAPKITNKGEFATDTTEIKRTIKTTKNNHIVFKMDNLEEMNKFLQMYNLQRLNQEEIKKYEQIIY